MSRAKPRAIVPKQPPVRGRYSFRSAASILRWLKRLRVDADPKRSIMIDVETDGKDRWRCRLRCVGVGYWRARDGAKIVASIPIARWHGRPYWSEEDSLEIRLAIRSIVMRHRISAQNAIFDRTVLQRLGYWPEPDERPFVDVMVLHHNTLECDAPHSLAFLSSRLDPPPLLWKGDVDHTAQVSGSTRRIDRDLRRYNVRDVWYQMLAEEMCWRWIRRDKTAKQNRVDIKKSVICANMHQVGAVIHLPTRNAIHRRLLEIKRSQREVIRELMGDEFNPASATQIATELYDRRGYYPVVDKRGRDLDEGKQGEDRLTGQNALIGLIKHGVDDETRRLIEALLVYKAANASDNTFVRSLPVRRHRLLDPRVYGVLRSTFSVHTVASGRLASTQPNLQNWPKRGLINVRSMIVAAPGHALVSADFDAGELRLWGVAIEDDMMLSAFIEGKKPHLLNGAAIFSALKDAALAGSRDEIYEKLVTWSKAPEGSTERRLADKAKDLAKTAQFSMQYGATFPRVRTTMRFARDKVTNVLTFPNADDALCRAAYDAWYAGHSTVLDWIDSVVSEVEASEKVSAGDLGRTRFFPGGSNKPGAPVNHKIQSWLAEKSDRALLLIADAIGHRRWSYWSGVMLQVHDEIIAQVPLDRVAETKEIFAEAFESYVPTSRGLVRMFGEPKAQIVWTGPSI